MEATENFPLVSGGGHLGPELIRQKNIIDVCRATGDNLDRMGIRSIRHKGLKSFYHTGELKGVPSAQVQKISDILLAIDEAAQPQEVGLFPGWKLHPLKGDLKGFWSVTVTANWRIIFRFERGDAFDVDLIDYH